MYKNHAILPCLCILDKTLEWDRLSCFLYLLITKITIATIYPNKIRQDITNKVNANHFDSLSVYVYYCYCSVSYIF